MYEEKLEKELRDYFKSETESQEPTLAWWDRTISNVTGQNKRSRWFGFVPKTRLAWVLLPLLLIFISGTVYAASTVIGEFFQKYTGGVGKNGLAQEMDLSQTINGVTVRLERAYADSNVVLLGLSISGPTDYFTWGGKLATVDGQNISGPLVQGFKPGSTKVFDNWAPSERAAVVDTFDTSSLTGVASELNLNLTIPVRDWTNPENNTTVVGVFTFNFKVPVHPGKIVDVNQTVEAAGIPITLQKVEISPYQTKVILQSADEKDSNIIPIISLVMPSGESVASASDQMLGPSSAHNFPGDFTGQHGEWTVTISELVFPADITQGTEVPGSGGMIIMNNGSNTNRLSGPWVFHFNVP
jgi:hypothetical protein